MDRLPSRNAQRGPIEDSGAGRHSMGSQTPLVGFQRTQRRPSGACVVSSAQPKGEQKDPLSRGLWGLFWVFLFPQVKLLQKRVVPFGFGTVEVIQQAAAAADHGEETTTGGKILHGILEVGGEMVNSFGQQGDLHIGGSRVLIMETVTGDDLAFRGGRHGLKGNTYAKMAPSQCRKMVFHGLADLGIGCAGARGSSPGGGMESGFEKNGI